MNSLEKNLALLADACADPRARLDAYLEQGKQVIGCFPVYTPEEIVHACGMIPMGLWGGAKQISDASGYLPPFACSIMQSNMELGLSGAYKGLSAVIIPCLCDTFRCMTQNWRFGVRSIPMIPLVHPQNRKNDASVDYLISEYENIVLMLTTITGRMLSEDSLKETIEIYNRHTKAMRAFAKTANDHLDIITPKVRHSVMKSAFFYEKGEHTEIVRAITRELEQRPKFEFKGHKVLLAGITCEPDEILDILEEYGFAVAGDDLAQEMRQYRTFIPDDAGTGLRRLSLQWQQRHGCSLIHEDGKPRGRMLAELCRKTGAEGVISCMMQFCDPEEYDQPYYEKVLRQEGIPYMSISIDQQNTSFEQIRTRIESFADVLA